MFNAIPKKENNIGENEDIILCVHEVEEAQNRHIWPGS
jgi:hypothetical protein